MKKIEVRRRKRELIGNPHFKAHIVSLTGVRVSSEILQSTFKSVLAQSGYLHGFVILHKRLHRELYLGTYSI